MITGPSGLAGPGAVSSVFGLRDSDISAEGVSMGAGDDESEAGGVKVGVGSEMIGMDVSVGLGSLPGSGEVRPPYDQSGPRGMDGP